MAGRGSVWVPDVMLQIIHPCRSPRKHCSMVQTMQISTSYFGILDVGRFYPNRKGRMEIFLRGQPLAAGFLPTASQ